MITAEEAVKIIADDKKRHKFYKESVEYALDIAIHADSAPPGDLLRKRRPKESKAIQEYRETIYIEKTEAPVFKVMNSLMKIRKSQDWMIKYPKEIPSKIAKDETLEQYMELQFPRYSSFTNWFFSVGFKQYLIDANAVSLIIPDDAFEEKTEAEDLGEYKEPYPVIYNSAQVLSYSQEYYLLHSKETNSYVINKQQFEGNIYYLITDQSITQIKETDPKPVYEITEYLHGLTEMPVVKLGGAVKNEMKDWVLYKSRISPMVPELKEALREYSDLQAEVVQHVHSTLWSMGGQKCSTCKGLGSVTAGKDKAPIACKDCKGKGTYPFNPFENFEVREPKAGETAIPTPPAGFIQKDIAIAELQDKRVQDHIYNALAAINFEFLMKTPLNQSGTAKQVDRSEMESFVHSVAEDVIRIYDDHYSIINDYRYGVIIPNEKERAALLPFINVPAKYDILSEEYLIDEIAKARTSSIDPSVINAALIEYANKKFGADDDIRKFVINCIDLDPFASEHEDMITLKLQNGGIDKQQYVIHCNIKSFVRKAFEADATFADKTFEERMAVMETYAAEVIVKNSAQAKVMKLNAGNNTKAA